MIVTVTMNPAIDKTVETDELRPGALNRITKVEYDAGGKGINVSKTIRELGGESIAMGFLCGGAGRMIESALNNLGIRHDFLWGEGETRTNLKVHDKSSGITELNEPGPLISREQTEEFLDKLLSYAGEKTLFVLSGSVPGTGREGISSGVDKRIYEKIIHLIHEKGAKALLDAEGELFRSALAAKPDIIKPNRMELEKYLGCNRSLSKEELIREARELQKKGTGTVMVSMGAEGALFVQGDYTAFSPALPVQARSTVGAGDAMVAALACAWEKALGAEETFRLCVAAAAGAVMTAGTKPAQRKVVDELVGKVMIERLTGAF